MSAWRRRTCCISAALSLVLLGTAVLLACGCAKKGPARAETAPFEAAIAAYLKQNNLGMKVAEFKSLTVTGDSATGTVAMQEAEGMYDLKVTWVFTFRKDKDGWKAVSYKSGQ